MLVATDILTGFADAPDDMVVMEADLRFAASGEVETLGGQRFTFARLGGAALREGDAFLLSDGRAVSVLAAEEDLLEVQGDLHRLAYHIGRAGVPCAVELDRLLVPQDEDIHALVLRLGGFVKSVHEAFHPEDDSAFASAAPSLDEDEAHDDGHDRLFTLMQGDDPAGFGHHDHDHDAAGACIPRLR